MVTFWITNVIHFAPLKYKKYKSFNIKIDCEEYVLEELKNYLKTKDIFGQD